MKQGNNYKVVKYKIQEGLLCYVLLVTSAGLEIATNTIANATSIFSLATKNSGLVATLATRFLYDIDLN